MKEYVHMDENVLKKLENAFANDASDEQACFLANISTQTLYNYQKEHPEYVEQKKMLKNDIKYQAKLKIKQAILSEEKPDTAKWYLERKDSEFKTKNDLTTNDKDLQPLLVKFIDNDNQYTPRI